MYLAYVIESSYFETEKDTVFRFLKLVKDQSSSLCLVLYNSSLLGVKCPLFVLMYFYIVYCYMLQAITIYHTVI